jgi:hypothetical protein
MSLPPYTFDRSKVAALAVVVVIALAGIVITIGPIKTARAGNTWQVDKSYASDLCNSDNLRCQSLKDAVAAAESGDRIRITTGRYDGENDILIENKNLTITGAGQLQMKFVPNVGNVPDETSGTWITAYDSCFGCSQTSLNRVLHIKNSTVTVSGMWIGQWLTVEDGHGGKGGAVLNEGGTVTFSGVRVAASNDGSNGGAVYNDQGTMSFTDCNIFGRSGTYGNGPAGGSGGGIYNDQGTLHLTRCAVGGNIGWTGLNDGGSGAGIFNKGGTITIANSTIEGGDMDFASSGDMPGTTPNRAGFNSGRGGGIFNEYPGKITITDSEIKNNKTAQGGAGGAGNGFSVGPGYAGGSGGAGGGIYNEGEMKIVGSTIAGNATGDGGRGGTSASIPGNGSGGGVGGGIYNGGTLTIENSTISDNATGAGGAGGDPAEDETPGGDGGNGGRGGGIYNQNKLTLTNVTISGNTTGGGGVGATSITDSGTAGIAGHGGGVVSAPQVAGANITILNTIIAGNTTATGGSEPEVVGPFVSSGHNLIGVTESNGFDAAGDQQGSSASPLNAKLGPRQSNGGPTSTYDPLDGSPAINAGDDSVTGSPSSLKYDQRGVGYIRKFNGQVDIGAVEKQPPSNPPHRRVREFNCLGAEFVPVHTRPVRCGWRLFRPGPRRHNHPVPRSVGPFRPRHT